MTAIVGYARVSTAKQGKSGLGLEAQKQAIEEYAAENGLEVAEIFVEVESGKNATRPQLKAAIEKAKELGAVLVIAKLDRLSRNVSFLFALKEAKVDFLALDCRELNTLTLAVIAGMAQHEAEKISERTKAGLEQAKKRGKKLGNPQGLNENARAAAVVARKEKAKTMGIDSKKAIEMFLIDGYSLREIAKRLESLGCKTAKGNSHTAASVSRLIKLYGLEVKAE